MELGVERAGKDEDWEEDYLQHSRVHVQPRLDALRNVTVEKGSVEKVKKKKKKKRQKESSTTSGEAFK